MKRPVKSVLKKMAALPLLFLAACAPHPYDVGTVDPVVDTIVATKADTAFLIKQDVGSYCRAGEIWGGRLRDMQGALYGEKQTDPEFSSFLRTGESPSANLRSPIGRFYFGVTGELKQKFNSCFTTAYDRMDAEKVLGQHIAKAAHDIGAEVGDDFAQWPLEFFKTNIPKSTEYNGRFVNFAKEINDHALLQLEYFNELLTVGSPADRQAFKVGFVCHYNTTMVDVFNKLKELGVSKKAVKPEDSLTSKVNCSTPSMESVELVYNRKDEVGDMEIPGLIYANHPLFAKDADDLGFRVFTGEELYMRFYRRALHEAGLTLGKKLYHGLMSRNDGLDYLRNLALAIEAPDDMKKFFNPGFLEAFDHQGNVYLADMMCAIDKSSCPVVPMGTQRPATGGKAGKSAKVNPPEAPKAAAPKASIEAPAKEAQVSQSGEGPCFVHVGVFANESNTQIAKEQLEKADVLNVLMREVALNEGKVATQVRVGPFASRDDANSMHDRLSKSFPGPLGGTACLTADAK
ncbi:MAG: SPOR domain-containing protein [Magnetococcales bacterium]|nr:SPOR domain-containing protein [Magnetococcales bacterium]MBF0347596.1 SPOR domain-containing protein [Magnetococcales bacterium]MBF0630115.1 SPOR domain-containing protein [Magnetococcales bacterium]